MTKTERQLARELAYRLQERNFARPVILEEVARQFKIPPAQASKMINGCPRSYSTDDVFNYIVTYKREHDGLSPSLRDIEYALDMGSYFTAASYVQRLVEEGRITTLYGKRGIMVNGGKWTYG